MESSWVNRYRFAIVLVLLLLFLGGAWLLVSRFFTFEDMKRFALELGDYSSEHPVPVSLALFACHLVGMTFSLPTKGLLTILSGALLGPYLGAAITFSGVLCGTTALFFWSSRLRVYDSPGRFARLAKKLESRLRRHPFLAVAGLRLVITLPYGPITIASALSGVGYRPFILGSFLGDIPVVVLYSLAGERLAHMASSSDAVSPLTLIILCAAGIALLAGALFAGKKERSSSQL